MPKYSRKRFPATGPPQVPPYIAAMPPPVPLPPVPLMPAAYGVPMMALYGAHAGGGAPTHPFVPGPPGASPRPKRGPKKKKFRAAGDPASAEGSGPSVAARACLPYFQDELSRTHPREPTDVVIIDFDRALLATPQPSAELLSAAARHTLEAGLGDGCNWWQCRAVLDAALELGAWNEALLELAREASRTPEVVLVITTARSTAETPRIESALRRQGVLRVDHFACSTQQDQLPAGTASAESGVGGNSGADEGRNASATNRATDAGADTGGDGLSNGVSNGTAGTGQGGSGGGSAKGKRTNGATNQAKQAMLELLLESYASLERVCIFEGSPPARRRYLDAVADFVRNGWVHAEAVQIVDMTLPRAHLPTRAAERALVERVVRDAAVPVKGTVVVKEWVHKLTEDTRRPLMAALADALGDRYEKLFAEEDLSIAKGRLPADMRYTYVPQRDFGIFTAWHVVGYHTENRVLWLRLACGDHKFMLKAARLSRLSRCPDEDVTFASEAVPGTIASGAAAAAEGTNSDAPDADRSLKQVLSDLPGGYTFVYERRELQIERSRPDAAHHAV